MCTPPSTTLNPKSSELPCVSFLDASACHPDGWEDLFVVSGHLYPEADKFNMGLQYRQTPLVFLNNRDKTFREVSAQLGLTQHWKARGMAVGDFDNDGRLDILINNLDDGPVLLHNQMENTGHWLLAERRVTDPPSAHV